MSAIAIAIKTAVHNSALASAATYRDAGGADQNVRVVVVRDYETVLGAADVGVRGDRLVVQVLKSAIQRRPAVGDSLLIDGVCHRVDEVSERDALEWILYVVT